MVAARAWYVGSSCRVLHSIDGKLVHCNRLMVQEGDLKLYGNPLNAIMVKQLIEGGIEGLKSYISEYRLLLIFLVMTCALIVSD